MGKKCFASVLKSHQKTSVCTSGFPQSVGITSDGSHKFRACASSMAAWQHQDVSLQAASVILIQEAVIEQEMVTREKQCCLRCHNDRLGAFTETQQRSDVEGNPCPAQVVLPVRTNHCPPLS